ncbi:MAG TPA: HlyC/CorC family transporter [Flavobacteriales bacterium]|nr:HlyC/CorC family transporter [Flavobacteriales bacterium]HIO67783.1 HlyC/CorC family transporter [Flavobacteriales bacterium]
MENSYLVLLTLLLSAFFSGMEIAFVSANKLRIELLVKQGSMTGKIYSYFLKHPSKFIGCMLVGNNIALVIYGITMAKIIEPSLAVYLNEFGVLLFQTLIATIIVLVTAEFIPKTLFRINPNQVLRVFTIPAIIAYGVLFIPVLVTIGLSELILNKVFNVKLIAAEPAFGKVDLDEYVAPIPTAELQGKEDPEIQIFRNALDFSNVKLRDCMVPRTEIISMNADEPIATLKDKFVETGLSKIIIYRGDIENVVGYTHSFEMFNKPKSIHSMLLPISLVPESMAASEMLKTFIKQQRSAAIVIDEFGGVSGLVTIEDVIEEIFGEIDDEHDKVDVLDEKLSDTEYLLSGRLEIDQINEKYNIGLPESEDYETLSGLITYYYENIPALNEEIEIEGFKFLITQVSETHIESSQVHILPRRDESE